MPKQLVIVESPAKARTISKFLGKKYDVKASLGHVRDLPKSKLGVDVDNDFAPQYITPRGKGKVVGELRKAAKNATTVYLATDPDREGEAISWHLAKALKLDENSVHRVTFHEITKKAIQDSFRQSQPIDMNKVQAQQARRILDRLVGYKLSPLLWQKIRRGLSAGRVQSVALQMIVQREREIENFTREESWSIEVSLAKLKAAKETPEKDKLQAKLISLLTKGKKKKLAIKNGEEAEEIVNVLRKAHYSVSQLKEKKSLKQPYPPLITSTLQQEAWHKLRFSAQQTMRVAQQLYEGLPIGDKEITGLITYMRTDSLKVSTTAISETRDYVKKRFGKEFIPSSPRSFVRKVKGAQEAHEAIRPTSIMREPSQLKEYLTVQQFKLYQLIWKRMVASQMSAAAFLTTTAEVKANTQEEGDSYLLRASSSKNIFEGFQILGNMGNSDATKTERTAIPKLSKGEELILKEVTPEQHFTQPPPRYTEAALVKALEENGIGRPSTYASIISAIQGRDYIQKENGQFRPQDIGITVSDMLTENFPDIINIGFTAQMEESLDKIANGDGEYITLLQKFYTPFQEILEKAKVTIDRIKLPDTPTDEICPKCGKPMVIKTGRYGKFIACSGYPQCKTTKTFSIKTGAICPQCGGDLIERKSKKGRKFYGCSNYPTCNFATNKKPLSQPCPQCGSLLVEQNSKMAHCTKCETSISLQELKKET